MRKIIVKLLTTWISDKQKKKEIRSKLLKNPIKDLMQEIQLLHQKIDVLESNLERSLDITKFTPSKGVLHDIQMLSLEILKVVDKICRKHNIQYWLDFGTLLGAIRHKGFIPWDDDVDICMHIDDFEKFCKIVDKEFEGTCCRFKKAPSHIGKCLHIDFTPKNDKEWIDFLNWELKGKLAFAVDIFPYYPSSKPISEIKKTMMKGIYKKSELLSSLKSYNDLNKIGEHIQQIHSELIDKNGKYLFLGIECIGGQPRVLETKDIFPLKEIEFEGYKFFAPAHCHRVLTKEYGNYWALPKFPHSHLRLEELDDIELEKLERLIPHE